MKNFTHHFNQRIVVLGFAAAVVGVACGRVGYEAVNVYALPGDGAAANNEDAGVAVDDGPHDVDVRSSDGGETNDAAAALDVGAAGADGAVAPDYCLAIPALPNAPVIDGVLDADVVLRPWVPEDWLTSGPDPAPPVGVHARYAVAWRNEGLYFFIDVVDPDLLPAIASTSPYWGDSLELYVDSDGVFAKSPDYDKPGTRQFIVMAPAADTMVRKQATMYEQTSVKGVWSTGQYEAFATPAGYVVEAFVRKEDLSLNTWSLAAGQRVGINLGHNVSVSTPLKNTLDDRLGQYFLRNEGATAARTGPFNNVATFCVPTLTAP
ncbi:MAG: sugar-binding protein [Deltaproteobacteria bacterium]|nr:sugar-binding protein [Deltaproteobacteria bacterium]